MITLPWITTPATSQEENVSNLGIVDTATSLIPKASYNYMPLEKYIVDSASLMSDGNITGLVAWNKDLMNQKIYNNILFDRHCMTCGTMRVDIASPVLLSQSGNSMKL